jgi:hypothetical protein
MAQMLTIYLAQVKFQIFKLFRIFHFFHIYFFRFSPYIVLSIARWQLFHRIIQGAVFELKK